MIRRGFLGLLLSGLVGRSAFADEKTCEIRNSDYVFEIYEASDQSWNWRLVYNNNNIIAHATGYNTKQNCQDAIESVARAAPLASNNIIECSE